MEDAKRDLASSVADFAGAGPAPKGRAVTTNRGEAEVDAREFLSPQEQELAEAIAAELARRAVDLYPPSQPSSPPVEVFRSKVLGGRLLSVEEATGYINQAPDALVIACWDTITAARIEPTEMRDLLCVARWLCLRLPWDIGPAALFVVSGAIPPLSPIRVRRRWAGHGPDYQTPTITIDADLWVSAEAVMKAYRASQRDLLGRGRRNRRSREAFSSLLAFVRSRRPACPWEAIRQEWNATNPERQFGSVSHIMTAKKRAEAAVTSWVGFRAIPEAEAPVAQVSATGEAAGRGYATARPAEGSWPVRL
jgi:hypothetical protein